MNVNDFFTRNDFEALQEAVEREELLSINETPFRKAVKVNGNLYELAICTGRYVFGDRDYYVSGWHDANYAVPGMSRSISGGNGLIIPLDSWENFKIKINKFLSRYPDYKEPEDEQISLFDL